MDFEDCKENIQPLATGRNASILQASLEAPMELHMQRQKLEQAIHNYEGDDPLEPWYDYISWIEQSYPSGGKESGLEEVMEKCLSRFEDEQRYYQDRRMVKLYIKFIDSHKDPTECYQQLFNSGIGTMIADFYIAWAYCYDLSGNVRKADEIFRRGLACRAQPYEELKEAHLHFGYAVAQRLMYKDDEETKEDANRQLHERRLALTSLRGSRRKAAVGSIRTGAVVKSVLPGTVQTNAAMTGRRANAPVQVFSDENGDPNAPTRDVEAAIAPAVEESKNAVRSIIDAARHQENKKEPGPWNKAHDKRKASKLFDKGTKTNDLGFRIHIDDAAEEEDNSEFVAHVAIPCEPPIPCDVNNYCKPFKYPATFCSKNRTQSDWQTPVTIEKDPETRGYPQYNKCMLYPRPNMEFQLEELLAYKYYKKRRQTNEFTKARDAVWSTHDVNANVRLYPNFARQSCPQSKDVIDAYYAPPKVDNLQVPYAKIYDSTVNEEFQCEELLARTHKILRSHKITPNETITSATDMEETICLPTERIQRRKSFFPVRKSIVPKASTAMSNKLQDYHEEEEEEHEVQIKAAQKIPASVIDAEQEEKQNIIAKSTEAPQNFDSVATAEANELPTSLKPTTATTAFEIYEDTIAQIAIKPSASHNNGTPPEPTTVPTADFKFKTPPLPTTNNKPVNKLPFEIYTESSPTATALQNDEIEGAGMGGSIFEDTCSTQIFNNFLKTQSMSTPKAAQKFAPLRRFDSGLKETADVAQLQMQRLLENKENIEEAITSPTDGVAAGAVAGVAFSPLQPKQLSTILETSESHGTTQSTHTTGASTKSCIGTPDSKSESAAAAAATRATKTLSELPALQEQSGECASVNVSKTANVEEILQITKAKEAADSSAVVTENDIAMCTNVDSSKQQLALLPTTPAASRLPFAIFEDSNIATKPNTQVGNFTRSDEREDTAPSVACALPVGFRFQEDKTETISQMLKFQEDKTETLSKMYIPPTSLHMTRNFEGDKTGTIPKIPFKLPNFAMTPAKIATPPMHADDSFGFLTKTPPKAKQLSSSNDALALFEDELSKMPQLPTQTTPPNDSLLQFLNVSYKQPTTNDNKSKQSSMLHNSFMPDFSVIEETQPTQPKPATQTANTSLSFIKDSQPISNAAAGSARLSKFKQNPLSCNDSINYSVILDSQPAHVEHTLRTPQMTAPTTNTVESQSMLLMESFMKDFSKIKEPLVSDKRNSSTLKFADSSSSRNNLSLKTAPVVPSTSSTVATTAPITANTTNAMTEQYLEFAANESRIKNSTLLPQHDNNAPQSTLFRKKSLHIKSELPSPPTASAITAAAQHNSIDCSYTVFRSPPLPAWSAQKSAKKSTQLSFLGGVAAPAETSQKAVNNSLERSRTTLTTTALSTSKSVAQKHDTNKIFEDKSVHVDHDDNDAEMSIYYKKTPKTPKIQLHNWSDDDDIASDHELHDAQRNSYVHHELDLNQSHQVIENFCIDPNVNPTNAELISAFLSQIDFTMYISALPNCQMLKRIPHLRASQHLCVHDVEFKVQKLIGEGAYGAVYCAQELKTLKKYALKQERPPNYWEYYICLEVHSRLRADEMLPAFMNVDYALIGNNASILITPYSAHGSLINVCNQVKKATMRNVDEYVVMYLTCEMLEIVDHLHAINIIHADIKADNFLLIQKIDFGSKARTLQLIDFGVSIDMKLFKPDQKFIFVRHDNAFKCVEMREKRPWTYQLDLYGLAGVIHVLLFGKYMDIERRSTGTWMHRTQVPRYFNRPLWESIFKALLNVRDCDSLPNLQDLRMQLKEELAEKENIVMRKIDDFNKALSS